MYKEQQEKQRLRSIVQNTPITKNSSPVLQELTKTLEAIEKEEWKLARQNIQAAQSIIGGQLHGRI